jgi:molybdate transport system ATP-binding protein
MARPALTRGLAAAMEATAGRFGLVATLEVRAGETVAILGPNGAGKTTLLRALAGLLPLDRGRVVLDGDELDDVAAGRHVPAEHRPIGMVFQDHLLFPHLSALDNVAFGLRSRGASRDDARRLAAEWLARVGLGGEATARPRELSAGQAQRVALARALAVRPRLLLLDEPLSALDVTTRLATRRELRRHLAEYDGTRLLVTHDPLEAVALADRLVVLEAGRVTQTGSPAEITGRPRSDYVADLVGVNLFRGRVEGDRVFVGGEGVLVVPGGDHGGGDVFAVVHPRAVALHRAAPEGTPRNVWAGVADGLDLEGERARVRVGGRLPIVAEVTAAAAAELRLADGGPVWVSVKATEITVYPA